MVSNFSTVMPGRPSARCSLNGGIDKGDPNPVKAIMIAALKQQWHFHHGELCPPALGLRP